jgi:hypothetical protein
LLAVLVLFRRVNRRSAIADFRLERV